MRVLLLITRTLSAIPAAKLAAALAVADDVILMQNGVYNTPEMVKALGVPVPPPGAWRTLTPDVEARRVASAWAPLDYAGLVDCIEKNDKVITL